MSNSKNEKIINVGTFVKSHFRSRWQGIIESFEVVEGSGKKSKKICNVLILKDSKQNDIRTRTVARLDANWLDTIPAFELTEQQVNWISNHKLRAKYNQ